MVQLVPFQESEICTVADKFLSIVVSQHGLPDCIMSDHYPCSFGHFWDKVMSLVDMTLTFSIVSHQTNRMAEVTNHTTD